jgi:SlyX protein
LCYSLGHWSKDGLIFCYFTTLLKTRQFSPGIIFFGYSNDFISLDARHALALWWNAFAGHRQSIDHNWPPAGDGEQGQVKTQLFRENDMDVEKQIIALEEQVSYQDQTISDLNHVILEQQKIIERLEFRVTRLEDKMKELTVSGVQDISEESPPPHY